MGAKFSLNSNFWAKSPVASWIKVFVSAVIAQYLISLIEGYSLFSWDKVMLEKLLTAGAVAVLPVIINFINKKDTRYGLGSKRKTVTK